MKTLLLSICLLVSIALFAQPGGLYSTSPGEAVKLVPVTLQARDWLYVLSVLDYSERNEYIITSVKARLKTAASWQSATPIKIDYLEQGLVALIAHLVRNQPYPQVAPYYDRIVAGLKASSPFIRTHITTAEAREQNELGARLTERLRTIKQPVTLRY